MAKKQLTVNGAMKLAATLKAARTSKTVAAKVAVVADAVEHRTTYTKNTREAAELQGCGLNTFGSWVGTGNVLASVVRWIALNYAILCEAIGEREGEIVAHVTVGNKGTHAGLCMKFANVKITAFDGSEWTGNVYLKDNGVLYTDSVCNGFSVMSESELRLQAVKTNDVRKVRLDVRKVDTQTKVSTWEGSVVDAALLGTLQGRYQGLLYRDVNGARVVTRIFGEAKDHEDERAVSVVTLAGDTKEQAKAWIFDGIAEAKAKVTAKGKAAAKNKVAKK